MKIAESMKIIDQKWVTKQEGFRFNSNDSPGPSGSMTFLPLKDASLLDSDVTAWRLAWKLAQSTPLSGQDAVEGDMADICVVDQRGNPVENYATGEMDVFNRRVREPGEENQTMKLNN